MQGDEKGDVNFGALAPIYHSVVRSLPPEVGWIERVGYGGLLIRIRDFLIALLCIAGFGISVMDSRIRNLLTALLWIAGFSPLRN